LQKLIDRDDVFFNPKQCAFVIREILKGLLYLKEMNILHRGNL